MEHEIHRVVSLQPSATVILERLGMLDRVVACTRHCQSLCPAKGVPTVEDSWTAQSRQIRDARPDLVIASVPYQPEALAEILRAGVRVLALAPHSLADVYADISVIANLFGEMERGRALIDEIAAADPDVIVAAWCGAGNRVPLENVVQARSWAGLRAVRERRVYCVPDEWLTTPAPTLVKGLRALAAIVHPDLFEAPPGMRRIGEIQENCID